MAVTVEALERERYARLKEAVAGEPDFIEEEEPEDEWRDERREGLQSQVKAFTNLAEVPTCTTTSAAETLILRAMKAGKKQPDLRLDFTMRKLLVLPADVLQLGEALRELTVVGNRICELPTDLGVCRRLRVLNLAANELSGLPNLLDLGELAHVGMAFNRVDDRSLPMLVRSLPESLSSLDLGANQLCSLDGLIESVEERGLAGLKQLTLKGNPLCIARGYKQLVAASSFGAKLSLLDEAALPAPQAADEAEADLDAPDEHEEGVDSAEAKAKAKAKALAKRMATIRVTVEKISGVPMPAEAADAPAAADAATGAEVEPAAESLVLSFSLCGETRSTKPVPRSAAIEFEETSAELQVERTVALRDALLVHGLCFDVLSVPTPPEPTDDAAAEDAAPPADPVLIGTIATRWEALAAGEEKLTQVCQQIVQPPAPEGTKAKRGKKPAPLPLPFTLSLTVTVELVEPTPPEPPEPPEPEE